MDVNQQEFDRERFRRGRRLDAIRKEEELTGVKTEYQRRRISKEAYEHKKQRFKEQVDENRIIYTNCKEIGMVKLGPKVELRIRAVAYAGGKFIEIQKIILKTDRVTGEIKYRYQPKEAKISIPVKYPKFFAEDKCYDKVHELLGMAINEAVIMDDVGEIVYAKINKEKVNKDEIE